MAWQWLVGQLRSLWARGGKVGLSNRRALWGGVLFFLALAIVAVDFLPQKLDLKVGQPSPRDIKAPQGIVYESEVLTARAREEAERRVEPVYRIDNTVTDKVVEEARIPFQSVRQILLETSEASLREERLKTALSGWEVDNSTIKVLASAGQDTLNRLEEGLIQIIRRHMQGALAQEALESIRGKMLADVEALSIEAKYKSFLAAIVRKLELKPTLVYDVAATLQRREKARAEVAPVQVTIRQGEKIVGDGEIVTEEDIEALQKLGLLRPETPWRGLVGLGLLQGVLVFLMLFYLRTFKRKIYGDDRLLLLLGLLWVVFLVFSRGVTAISLGNPSEMSRVIGYLIPVAAGSMLTAILVDAQVASVFTVFLALEAGILGGNYFHITAAGIVSGLTGVYCVNHLDQRSSLARSSIFITLANMLAVLALGLLLEHSLLETSLGLGLAVANGVLSAVLTIGFLPFLENTFGITTAVKLLELSNPNHPLLKRLLLEAPGTYHHSLLVANLAEAAADAIGADSLLARIGAYYHDIGKLKRPYFFIENQVGMENPHDKLSPSLSSLIISCHVKDGLELAREFGLPSVVQDIIAQHHGTTLMSFFYHKACEKSRGLEVDEEEFRYETPKPQTKEAAIVMLADSVEAGIRALPKITPNRMEGFVRRIIKEKLEDGQLENSDLTFRDLALIGDAFLKVLNGIYHSRVEYPEVVLREMERRRGRNGVLHKQSAG
ncbi:MAG: HDIG domain-containing protein [Thermanaeromonas sp.]|uniref:HD family phosphohydrolase n=1 Tax=Thermanaeromonas sp. TaxID=2003697 RepID=UPI00243F280A|nr:HDIG domain-containing metalloprotein [Thermanaeromonas sp.]MCG0277553.1 HDIG domain-containing protein [Thermanaeromonas sp.]